MIRRLWPGLLVLLLTVLTLSTGCDDDEVICQPLVPAGRIQGWVHTGMPISQCTVRAVETTTSIDYTVTPGANGAYSLDLPRGQYELQVLFPGGRYAWTAQGLSWGQWPADIITIDADHTLITADFILGSLTLVCEVPSELEDDVDLILHPREPLVADYPLRPVLGGVTGEGFNQRILKAAGLVPGDYQLELVVGAVEYMCCVEHDGEHIWWPGTRDRDAAPWVTVVEQRELELDIVVPEVSSRVSGRIAGVWEDLGLDRGPSLVMVTPDSGLVLGPRTVGDTPEYTVGLRWPEPVKVAVKAGESLDWIGGDSFEAATVLPLAEGVDAEDLDHEASGLWFEFGGVTDMVRSPVIGVYRADDGSLAFSLDEQGPGATSWRVAMAVEPGDYRIHLEPYFYDRGSQIWRPQFYDRATSLESAQTVTVEPGGVLTTVSFTLEEGGWLEGRLLRPADNDLYHVVVARIPATGEIWGRDFVFSRSSDGAFALMGLPDGAFNLGVTSEDAPGDTLWYPATADPSAATVFTIEDAGVWEGLDFDLR